MKICLLYPKWTGGYGKFSHFADKSSSWPPLHLAILAAIAEQKGHEIKLIDGQIENMSLGEMVSQASEFKPDIIGITATTPFYHIAVDLACLLKKCLPKVPIAIGGHHITVTKEQAFFSQFDYAFIGEAEISWSQFLDSFEKRESLSSVEGILYRENGKVVLNGKGKVFQDMDSLPLPARHLYKIEKYKMGTLKGVKNFTTVMTTKGCPFKCTFCTTEVSGNTVRKRSPKRVIDEIKSLIDRYNIRHFLFLDDTLTLNRKHILEICDLIVEENLDITFEGSTRANLVDEEIISKMTRAGLTRLSFGLESVDENIRRLMKKEVPLEAYLKANKLTNKFKIETMNSCMIGMPGETVETVCKTLSFLRKSHEIKQANLAIAVPYPGTELYEMAKKGDHGLKLLIDDFTKFRRYNSAVMKVGDLTPEDLVQLQNDAFVSIYLMPWRWISMYKRSGIYGLLLTFSRIKRSVLSGKINFITNKPREKRFLSKLGKNLYSF